MLQQWMEYAPDAWGSAGLWVAGLGAVAGLVLWLAGARFGRSGVTLVLVSLGALIGKRLPGWAGWSIDPMGSGIAGALIMGIAGYGLYRFWIALGLGWMMSLWTAWGVWVFSDLGPLRVPSISAQSTPVTLASEFWSSQPEALRQWLPIACGAALVSGFVVGLIWKRFATALMFSLIGVGILLGMGLLAALIRWPAALERIPAHHAAQAAIVAGLVAVGFAAQYRLVPKPAPAPQAPEDDFDD